MAKRQVLSKLKHLLITKAKELGNTGATTKAIIAEVAKENPASVEEAKDYLLEIAMGRLLSRALERSPRSVEPSQLTLWTTFDVPPQILIRTESGENIHKNLDMCTLREVETYANSLPTAKRRRSTRSGELEKMLATLKPVSSSEEDIVGECWEAVLAAKSDRTA